MFYYLVNLDFVVIFSGMSFAYCLLVHTYHVRTVCICDNALMHVPDKGKRFLIVCLLRHTFLDICRHTSQALCPEGTASGDKTPKRIIVSLNTHRNNLIFV